MYIIKMKTKQQMNEEMLNELEDNIVCNICKKLMTLNKTDDKYTSGVWCEGEEIVCFNCWEDEEEF